MLNKSFFSILVIASAFVLTFGQTPEGREGARAAQGFAFSFDGGSYLGVQTQEVTSENFTKFNLREVRGVAVEKVSDNSPASAAGIMAGDVIVRFNGDEVASGRKLVRLIGEVSPDHKAKVTILRNGSEQEVTVTLAKRPMPPHFDRGNFSFSMPDKLELERLYNLPQIDKIPQLPRGEHQLPRVFAPPGPGFESHVWRSGQGRAIGVSVYSVTKQLGERFGVDGGVMISNVRENSAGAKAGLRAGDIIVEADGKAVKNNLDLIKAVNQKKDGDVTLTIVRDRNRQTINVTPEVSKDGGFFYQSDDDNGLFELAPPSPPVPMTAPRPAAPPVPPTPMRMLFPGRVI